MGNLMLNEEYKHFHLTLFDINNRKYIACLRCDEAQNRAAPSYMKRHAASCTEHLRVYNLQHSSAERKRKFAELKEKYLQCHEEISTTAAQQKMADTTLSLSQLRLQLPRIIARNLAIELKAFSSTSLVKSIFSQALEESIVSTTVDENMSSGTKLLALLEKLDEHDQDVVAELENAIDSIVRRLEQTCREEYDPTLGCMFYNNISEAVPEPLRGTLYKSQLFPISALKHEVHTLKGKTPQEVLLFLYNNGFKGLAVLIVGQATHFRTTYVCESSFSRLSYAKNKYRNSLSNEALNAQTILYMNHHGL
jgi:hypothetical protein